MDVGLLLEAEFAYRGESSPTGTYSMRGTLRFLKIERLVGRSLRFLNVGNLSNGIFEIFQDWDVL